VSFGLQIRQIAALALAASAVVLAASAASAEPTARFADLKPATQGAARPAEPATRPKPAPLVANVSEACAHGERRYWFSASVDELVRRARAEVRQGDVGEALLLYTQALDLNPSSGAALLELGKLRQQLNEYDDARAVYRRASEIHACAPEAFAALARLARARGNDAEACADLRTAIRLDPKAHARVRELAGWYVARRAWSAALELYRELIAELENEPSRAAELRRARIQARALSLLAGDTDPVAAGGTARNWVRRAIAAIARRQGLAR
jgi:tetratricopeptide (TPR) repeat protein